MDKFEGDPLNVTFPSYFFVFTIKNFKNWPKLIWAAKG